MFSNLKGGRAMNLPTRKFMLFFYSLVMCIFTSSAQAGLRHSLVCTVSDSRDYFLVYPYQLIHTSEKFSHYQLIDGLTVLVVNKTTMRFNRLSNFNLLPSSTIDPKKPPENYQFFTGLCKHSDTQENYKLKD